jgi:putative flippase GtrA
MLTMIKWLLVAGITFTSDLIIFIIAFTFSNRLLVSNVFSFALSTIINYYLHKFWTFRQDYSGKNLALKYIFALITSLFLNNLILYILSHFLNPILSKLLTSVILIPVNFMLMSKFAFKS